MNQRTPKLPEIKEDNVVKKEQQKGDVRPDGPGDDTAPVEPERAPAPRPREDRAK
jgi:hypothetical protein